MSDRPRVPLPLLATGVPGLDEVLGGGLPEYSLNLIAGSPGAGKTTLVDQIVFANASPTRPALFFTLLGEPPVKMLRYQQQLRFFDPSKVGSAIDFVNLGQVLLDEGLGGVLDQLTARVTATNPALVVVDSFQTIVPALRRVPANTMELQEFVERLAIQLTTWQTTTFLIGEYSDLELRDDPIATIADAIFWLGQSVHHNAVVRRLQVMKLRGQAAQPGRHTFRISADGITVFPRTFLPPNLPTRLSADARLSTGIPDLDAMMGGGIPIGNSVLVAGPPGTGKSILAAQFIAEGVHHDEVGLIVLFEQTYAKYLRWANNFGIDLAAMEGGGLVQIMPLQQVDLTPDEVVQLVWQAVARHQVKRVVIDSLTGFEVTVTTGEHEEQRQALYRLIEGLAALEVAVLATIEAVEESTSLLMTNQTISFLSDNMLIQRYVEISGRYERVIAVIKMRNSAHSTELRQFRVTSRGIVLERGLAQYEGISTGVATLRGSPNRPATSVPPSADTTTASAEPEPPAT